MPLLPHGTDIYDCSCSTLTVTVRRTSTNLQWQKGFQVKNKAILSLLNYLPQRRQKETQVSSRKCSGAASYQDSWQKNWPCIVAVKDSPHSFRCTLCSKNVSCGHQGERDVTHHITSTQHQRNAKSLKGTASLKFVSQAPQASEKVRF